MRFKDYYKILGIDRKASQNEIKSAYRKLAHKFHPDVSTEANAEDRFKEINEAYQTLKDPDLRKAYDELGFHKEGESFKPPPGWADGSSNFSYGSGEGVDLSDLFAEMARRSGQAGNQGNYDSRGSWQKRPVRGEDFELSTSIDLESAYHGTTLHLGFESYEPQVDGRLARVPKEITVRIPKGVVDGETLKIPGKAGRGLNGGKDGDIYLQVKFKPHVLFKTEGHHLHLELPLLACEAALGRRIDIPTLEGSVTLKIPPCCASGRKLRLANKGLPNKRGDFGDLFVTTKIVFPEELTSAERELFEKLEALAGFDPRSNFPKQTSARGTRQ